MTTTRDTDRLICALAAELRPYREWTGSSLRRVLIAAVTLGLGLAIAASLAIFADLGRLGEASALRWVCQKIVCMAACGAGAWAILEDLARPDCRPPRLGALLPAIALLLVGACFDPPSATLAGRSTSSVPACAGAIVLLSLPALALILASLRIAAAPTRATAAGAASGLLAGTLGAAAYALACRNNGGLFILVWYVSALALTSGLGALAGRKALAW